MNKIPGQRISVEAFDTDEGWVVNVRSILPPNLGLPDNRSIHTTDPAASEQEAILRAERWIASTKWRHVRRFK